MNIEEHVTKISSLIDEIDTESLTPDETNELLSLTESILNNIDMAENIPSVVSRFEEVNRYSQANKLATSIIERLEQVLTDKQAHDLKKQRKILSSFTPYDNE
ncbi:hypothetical protein [Photobacterium damselae]|uniref:hypothetical protein n=1 Tax=Photobacterium damselae TaxID=38293 RepID=UPI001F1C7844|nr:hypothetical protein [Photobacterium damselae]UKA04708.1 hypothetical protein IHC89_20935 [Photobacterium damselae subsp. damselae]